MNTTMETIILLVGQFFSALFLWIGIALVAERATISALQKRFIQIFGALLFLVWFAATPLLAQGGFFLGVGIPLALVLTPRQPCGRIGVVRENAVLAPGD